MIRRDIYCMMSGLALVALTGCGGGGDSGSSKASSSISIAETSFKTESSAYYSAYVDVPFRVNYVEGDDLYYGVLTDTGNLLSDVIFYFNEDGSGYASVTFKKGYEIGNGAKSTTAQFALCHDINCDKHYSGSPIEVTLTNEVTLDQKIELVVPKIDVSADYSESFVSKDVSDVIALSGSNLYDLNIKADESSNVISYVSPAISNTNISLYMQMEEPIFLGTGTFDTEISVNACFDDSCYYPIEGSPLTVPVSYTITDYSTPGPDEGLPDTPAAGTEVTFDGASRHNVVDSTYSDALNVIAVVSNSPKNAIYFYDLNDSKSYEFELGKYPSSVDVDNINGTNRFVVGHDAMITTFDYNATSPLSTVTSNVFTSQNIYDLSTNGNFVWTLPTDDQWAGLQIIDLRTGAVTSTGGWNYYAQSVLKMAPSGSALYSLSTTVSPGDISRTDITDAANPSDPIDSPYHGDYEFCRNFWFNHAGTYIYTECGVRLNASGDAAFDMTYAGKITLPDNDYTWPYIETIQSLDESHNGKEVAIALAGAQNRVAILNSLYLTEKETFSLPSTTVNGSSYTTVPKFVFYDKDGKLNIVGDVTVNGISHTVIIQK